MTIENVVDSGACIGCGACAVAVPSIKINFNRLGDLVATLPRTLTAVESAKASAVCPFAGGADEDELAAEIFPGSTHHPEVGHYLSTYAAYSVRHRANGSSGGVATWVLSRLLERGLVDGVIHVAPSDATVSDRFFDYRLSTAVDEVSRGSTSFYYPVSMDAVLEIVRSRPGRYAVTGVPCFHKALRLLRKQDEILDERVVYQIGIVCGQMKSAHYLEFLSGHAGVNGKVTAACFRRKIDGLPANDYAFEVSFAPADGNAIETRRVLNSKIGANWGMGYFKPEACEYCDDVLAETADIAAMDAWLPRYVKDGAGWSLLVARSRSMQDLVIDGGRIGELVLEAVSAEDVAESQRGGFNHRRGAMGYRLWMNRHKWTPKKRIAANASYPLLHRIEQHARAFLRRASRNYWVDTGHIGDFQKFQRKMALPELIYKVITKLKRKFG